MIDNIMNAVMAVVTLWIIYKYFGIFFEKKDNKLIWSAVIWGAFYTFQVFAESQKGIASLVLLFLNIFFVLCIALVAYIGTIRLKLITTVFLYVMWMLVEYFTDSALRYIDMEQAKSVLVGSVSSKILMIILLQVVNRKKQKSNRRMPWSYWIILLIVPISSIYISYLIYSLEKKGLGYDEIKSLLAFILLLFINIIIFEVYDKLSYSLEIETENKIFEQQLVLLANNNEEKEKNYDDFKREQHDYINQIMAVKNHIKQGENNQAVELLNSMLNVCNDNIDVISKSGNNIVDTIINYKYSTAKKKGINFKLWLFIPEKLSFAHRDLCVILGNSLDNAIEATQSSSLPYIKMYMEIRRGACVIVIKNSFAGEIKKDDQGKLLTTKADKKYHGYGLGSIKKAAEKYQGQVIVDTIADKRTKDKEFVLMIILN